MPHEETTILPPSANMKGFMNIYQRKNMCKGIAKGKKYQKQKI